MKPLILITNDDGVFSRGLAAAVQAVADLAEIVIAAPHTQQTGMGRSFPRNEDTGKIDQTYLLIQGEMIPAYGVHGSPALSVAHGILELCERKPDLCISGINYGENLGSTVTCSGTLGAVFEAVSFGIPGIAISLEADLSVLHTCQYPEMDWKESAEILRLWTKKTLEEGMPEDVDLWNINVPSSVKSSEKYRITTQSRQSYLHFIQPEKREFSRPYNLGAKLYVDYESLEKDSDIHAVHVDHVISVTPMNLDLSVKMDHLE